MKVSLITVTYNSAKTLAHTIDSVLAQDYPDIEHIVIDGGSTDGTLKVIRNYESKVAKWISEPDNGIYDAMNKGIRLSQGDIVGIINSDDFYHRSDAISRVVNAFLTHQPTCVFADVRFVGADNTDRTIRYYSSDGFYPEKFGRGVMPAHPTFFTYRDTFEKFGYYQTDYTIAADFELLVRMLYRHRLTYHYLPIDLLKMRLGGVSTRSLKSTLIINQEILRACRENHLPTHYFKIYSKYPRRILEFLNRG